MDDGFRLFPERAAEVAGRVDALFLTLCGIAIFFTVAICLALLVFCIKYRRREGVRAKAGGVPAHLEAVWIGVPLVIVLASFAWGAVIYVDVLTPPKDAMEIHVTGKQWMWKIQHPTGQREINALHVPVGRKIALTMTSEDVIHSFYIPAFRVKRDVVPGMYTRLWFKPTKPGRYHLFCAEYCGTKHSEMIGEVVVMEPDRYAAWLAGQAGELPPVEAGKLLFESLRCNTCHNAESGARGPNPAGRWDTESRLAGGGTVLYDEDYVRESILEPRAKLVEGYEPLMPTYKGQVTEGQILQIIAYLKSLEEEGE